MFCYLRNSESELVKDLTTVKQGKATTVQDRSEKCFTEERQILNRWTEYCSELYNYKANGDPSVLNCTQTDTEDDHPIRRRDVEAAGPSLKKGKSARVDHLPAAGQTAHRATGRHPGRCHSQQQWRRTLQELVPWLVWLVPECAGSPAKRLTNISAGSGSFPVSS